MVSSNNLEIRKITPPNLNQAHLGKKIICYRPMRKNTPRMEIEVIGEQIIAHDYGQGGSGWTLAPGSAAYVNDLMIQSEHAKDLENNTKIVVIGAGVMGVFTAYDLYKRGYSNITIIAEKFEGLASYNAGSLLAPISMDNDSGSQELIDRIGIEAYKFYEQIAKKEHPDFKNGAIIIPAYFKSKEDSGLEPYVGKVMQPAKEVILDFGNGKHQEMFAYDDGIYMDTAIMMDSIISYLKDKGVKFIQQKISQFSDVDAKYIFNCTGLGAKEICNDDDIIPVQGHLIMLKDQTLSDLQHMILLFFDENKTESGQRVKRAFYMFPKHLPNSGENDIGVIGGSYIYGATEDTLNEEEFDLILSRAKDFYGILLDAN